MLYNCCVSQGSTNIAFCYYTFFGQDLLYCDHCNYYQHCFGCVGLSRKKYCILNKQYTKEEYFKLREKIIEHMKNTGEWGEFFAPLCSTFPYNDSIAMDFYPLKKKEALARGYKWKDKISRDFRPATIQEIPEDIKNVDDSICREILACENKECGKNYQIQKAELRFYRKMNLPIPQKCPDCRHVSRIKLRNPRKLFSRNCTDCGIDIQTTFAPDRPEKVLCEKCYLKVVN